MVRSTATGGGLGPQAAHHAAHPRQQLARLERLGQVVVGTGAEAGDAAFDRSGRGQHDDADRAAAAPQALDDGEPILARHVDVEDQDVGRLGSQQRVELGAGAGAAHRKTVRGQIVFQQAAGDRARRRRR